MKILNSFRIYTGAIIVTPNGEVWREVTRDDIFRATEKEPVYLVKIAGLEYTDNSVEKIAKPVSFAQLRINERDMVLYGLGAIEVILEMPVAAFTGQNRAPGEEPTQIFAVPVRIPFLPESNRLKFEPGKR